MWNISKDGFEPGSASSAMDVTEGQVIKRIPPASKCTHDLFRADAFTLEEEGSNTRRLI